MLLWRIDDRRKRKQDLVKVIGAWTKSKEVGEVKRGCRGVAHWEAGFSCVDGGWRSKESRAEPRGLSLAHPNPGQAATGSRPRAKRKRLARGPEARWGGIPLGHLKAFHLPRMTKRVALATGFTCMEYQNHWFPDMGPQPGCFRSPEDVLKWLPGTFPDDSDLGTGSRSELGPRHPYFVKLLGDSDA